jgi:histidinol-phosphate aminotransferase
MVMEKRLVRIAQVALELERLPLPNSEIGPTPGLLKLDENENTVGPSVKVSEAIGNHIRSWPLNWHGTGMAEDMLREKLAGYLSLPEEAISCFNGSKAAIECAFRTYLEPGVEALIDSPCDKGINAVIKSTGARVAEVKHENHLDPRIETIINCINPKTRLIFLSNPNTVSGTAYTESEIVFLLSYAERIMVVVQEEFVEFCGQSMADLVMRFPNLIIIRSFSNAYGLASLEASYLLTDPENMEFVERLKFGGNITGLACAAAISALGDPGYVRAYSHAVEQSKKIIQLNLPQTGYEFQLGFGNFMLLQVSDTAEAIELLSRESICVHDLYEHTDLESYLRITLGTPAQTEMLLLALGRSAEAFATGLNHNNQEQAEHLVNRSAIVVRELAEIG